MTKSASNLRRAGSPSKDPAGFNKTRAALLRSGMEMLTERGYSTASIDEILRRVGVPKGSFYYYFESKDAFGMELIREYSNFLKHKLDKYLSDEALSPLDRLVAFVEDATHGMTRYQFKRGCLVGNLGQEMGALPALFRAELQTAFDEWQQKIEQCIEAARRAGQISSGIDAKQAAYIFWIGWEGAVLRAKLEGSADALKAFSEFFLASLKR